MTENQRRGWLWGVFGFAVIVAVITGLVVFSTWGIPKYKVYQQTKSGEAALARAEEDRQIAVTEAQAKRDAASFLNEAEILRAQGAAEANHIINETLTEQYLRYLWITEGIQDGDRIYIATEAGLPILEARSDPTQITIR